MTPDESQQESLVDDTAIDEPDGDAIETEVEETPEPLVAVERWDSGLKEAFNSWGSLENGRDIQQTFLDYHTNQQGYHTKLEQELAPLRTESETWGGVFQPHQEFMMHNGLTPQDAARRGLGVMANIAQDPQAFALDILKRTQYDFTQHGQDAPYVPPEVQSMQREVDSLKQAQRNNAMQAQDNERFQLNQHIQSFANAQNESGELAHPHYQAVEQQMAQAVHGFRGMNQPIPPMQELYDAACKLNPEIQAQVTAHEVARETARKADKAKKALKAAGRPSGQHTGEKKERKSQKDTISDAYDKLAAAS